MEVKRIERRAIAASWFAVPAGYKKSDLGAAAPSSEQVEQMKKLIEGALHGQ